MSQLVRTRDGRVFEIPSMSRRRPPMVVGRQAFLGDDWQIGRDYRIGQRQYAYAGARRNLSQLRQAALAHQAGGFVAEEKDVTSANRLPMPIGPEVIPANTAADIAQRPQNAIKVQQFVVLSTNAPLFRIQQFFVGTDNQFVSAGQLNADFFSSAANQDVQLKGSTANLGNEITLRVFNTDLINPQTFEAMILGPTLRQYG